MLNIGLDTTVIKAKKSGINGKIGRGVCKGLSMIAAYNQVENALGIHLRYLQIMWYFYMSPGMGWMSQNGIIRRNYQRGGGGGSNLLGGLSGLYEVFSM